MIFNAQHMFTSHNKNYTLENQNPQSVSMQQTNFTNTNLHIEHDKPEKFLNKHEHMPNAQNIIYNDNLHTFDLANIDQILICNNSGQMRSATDDHYDYKNFILP